MAGRLARGFTAAAEGGGGGPGPGPAPPAINEPIDAMNKPMDTINELLSAMNSPNKNTNWLKDAINNGQIKLISKKIMNNRFMLLINRFN